MALLDLVLPPACGSCGRVGRLLCDRCRAELRAPTAAADRFHAPDAGVVLGDALELALAAFAYEGVLRRALQRLKYIGAARMARPLAEAAAPVLRRLITLGGPALLVPVPVHVARQRERGYNQALLLATELGRLTGLAVDDLLRRPHATAKQHRLDRAGRLRNLRGAFVIRSDARPPPAVIVVDDILTTSATLEACASVLREAGVLHAYGFAIGREV
ncbi:MAG TPA: ComF family protein [Candidatus Limnocylindria bacterium]|nr:ComF family protein [Candidatus Limnocylindria bacterium]